MKSEAGSRKSEGAKADIKRVGVVGLGLIGGSLARDLAAQGIPVVAYDRDVERLRGLPKRDFDGITLASSIDAVVDSDVVLIAVPVSSALDVLSAMAPSLSSARLVMDVGSTKRSIVALAERLGIGQNFVGGHPMAGDHHFGWSASRRGLFAEAPVYLCPTASTGERALAHARALWESVGARTLVIDAAVHDERLAWTSHMPHAVAAALALSLDTAGVARGELGPGGRDMTRVAGSSPDMWAQIWMDNAAHVVQTLHAMEARLHELRERIERGDEDAVRAWFADGRKWFVRGER